MDTKIYLSKKGLYRKEKIIKDILKKYNYNMFKYSSNWQGVAEDGFEIVFFEKIRKIKLFSILKKMRSELFIICFYVKNEDFEGCINEYLLGKDKGCIEGNWLNKKAEKENE